MKSEKAKAIHICFKGRNVKKAIFCWKAKITCQYQKQGIRNKVKKIIKRQKLL